MRTALVRRVVLSSLIVATLIGSNLQPMVATPVLAQDRSDPNTPDRAVDPETQISGPSVDASLERAPDPDKAVVVDQANPQWRTVYGTEAGRQLLPPRQSEVPAQIEGAVVPLNGFWITRTISAGTNGISAIAYAPDGRLFAGLSNGGLRVYGPNSSGIYGWTSINASPGGLPSNWVTSLAVFNGDLWVGTSGSGVGLYDLTSGAWISYTVANSPLPHDTINRLTPVVNPNGADYIWISTNGGGAARFTPGRPNPTWNIINTVDGLPSNLVYDVAVDYNGATLTTWFANYGGLTSWNGTTFSNSLGGGSGSQACTFFYTKRVLVDRQHRVWFIPVDIVPALVEAPQVDITAGVCVRTVSSGPLPLVFWTRYNTTSPGLPNNDVSDISEDFAGRIWLSMQGSSGGGAVYDNGTWKLYTTPTSPLLNNDLRRVLAVGEAVWWGHGGVNAFTTHSPSWLRYSNVPSTESPQAIFLEATRTWIGGTSRIAYTDGGAFTTVNIPGNTSYVSSFARAGNGDLWIGTSGNGVYKYASGNFAPYTTTSGLPNNGVNALLSDHLGRIWAGTNNGLALRAEAGYWLTFTTSTSPIVGNIVQALARDSSDRLWIGTTNGVSVYDLNGPGSTAWISYTTTSGLPFNMITGLSPDTAGNMWASTYGGGVASFNPSSNTWTTFSATLPHTQTLDITSDPTGRIWTATAAGLALRQGSTWRSFRVPESALESHRLADVASDIDRTWVQGTTGAGAGFLAVRGVITSPIGSPVPVLASFTPISATPGATIIINGNYFDNRGPEFNVVKFPDMNHFATIQAEVISVTTTSIAVKVPALASSGKLQVEANGLKSPLSTTNFQLMPKITSLSATCLGVGSELKISGLGFLDGSAAAYVKIGSGAERIADATDPTQLRTFIRPGDTNGQVRVRLLNGNQVFASQTIALGTIQVNQSKVQQAIEGERLIWGKRTLVQLGATSVGCNGAKITRATLYWKFSNGLTINGGVVNFPNGKALPSSTPNFSLDNAVSVVGDLDISSVANQLNFPSAPFISSLPFFTGVDVVLRNNNVDVLTVNLAKSKFNFVDTAGVRRRFIAMKVTGNTAGEQDASFSQNMYAGFAAVARIYPQQDGWYTGGRYSWLHDTPFWFSLDYKVKIAADGGNHSEARGKVEDFLDPSGKYWAIALIDQMNLTGDSGGGISSSGWRTVVAANTTNRSGRYMAHELLHAFGFVDSDAANYQPSDVPGEDNHSKYNEGRWSDFVDCVSSRTYRQALQDFTDSPNKRVVRLLGNDAPKELRTAACNSAAADDQTNTAKSIISYAPSRNNFNTVLEPVDYRELLKLLCQGGGCPGYSSPALLNTPIDFLSPAAANAVTRTLRLGGEITSSGLVTPSISYVGIDDGEVTPQQPGGDYHLIVRDAGNNVLHDQIFELEGEALTPHDSNLAHGGEPHSPDHATADVSLFQLRVPFPVSATKAEIVHDNNILWSKTVSPNAPTVSVTAPNGGTFNAANPITVTWSANDLDGDALQFGLDYSADNGANWLPINPYIVGNSLVWTPGYVTATNTARVRLRASDGFNTAFATSAQFALTAQAPQAIILSPDEGATFAEGETIELKGLSLTNDGLDAGSFLWQLNGATVGATRTISTPLTAIGVNTITLQITANALNGSRSITVTVIPDYDRDGLPNAWELQYQLNPLDASDATANADGDTLSNADEYALGTNPRSGDTDADGFSDSAEINAGTDPLNPASTPNPNPVLNVGSVSMGFTINDYDPIPGPQSTWVSNSGGGSLNFNVAKDATWLNVSPTSGAAPQELTVSANHSGLSIGTYQGHITVTSPGVSGSPHMITVTLTINSIPNYTVYLPLVLR
jgi:ligand-binding sensor domain-containing protein